MTLPVWTTVMLTAVPLFSPPTAAVLAAGISRASSVKKAIEKFLIEQQQGSGVIRSLDMLTTELTTKENRGNQRQTEKNRKQKNQKRNQQEYTEKKQTKKERSSLLVCFLDLFHCFDRNFRRGVHHLFRGVHFTLGGCKRQKGCSGN